MDDRKRLVSGFLGFLAEEVKAKRPSEELAESLEVAMQCLESAYNIAPQDVSAAGEVPLLSLLQKQVVCFYLVYEGSICFMISTFPRILTLEHPRPRLTPKRKLRSVKWLEIIWSKRTITLALLSSILGIELFVFD
jgi:hypothetical protein